jgi:O-antigen/teichoic acid export membrane protein
MVAAHHAAQKTIGISRLKRVGWELAWITIGNASAMLGALVAVRVVTSFLDPAAYGQVALGMTLATFVNQVVTGPLANGAARFYAPAVEAKDLAAYWCAIRTMILHGSAWAALLIVPLLVALGLANQSKWMPLGGAALLFAVVCGCNSILSAMQGAARQRAIVAFHQGVDPWLRLLFGSLAMLASATSTMATVGYAAAAGLVLVSQYRFFLPVLRRNSASDAQKVAGSVDWRCKVWAYSWPFGVWGGFSFAQLASDRWSLGLFVSTREVGLYTVLFQLGYYPISVVAGVAMQLLAPIFYARAGAGSDAERNASVTRLSGRLARLTIATTGLVFLVGCFAHTALFRLIAPPEFASVSYLLPWMVLGGGLFAVGQIFSLNLMSRMQTRRMLFAKIATSVLGVGLNIWGAYWCGIAGVVAASVVFSSVYLLWMMLLGRQGPS